MIAGKDRHLFPGSNTAFGFFSYYDHIASPQAIRVLIIKGGPGVGKSTMMRRIGNSLQGYGYAVEYLHCSSDPASLDGIHLPELEVTVVDGTAPHMLDPRNPGAVDEILHLGEFWNETALRAQRNNILTVNMNLSRTFSSVYRHLAAAKHLYDDIRAWNETAFNPGVANLITASLIKDLFGNLPTSAKPGRIRHLFASAITPDGPTNYLTNLMDAAARKCIIKGMPGSGCSSLVKRIVHVAAECGLYVEAFHCGFDPYKYEHALVPQLGLAIITSAAPHEYQASDAQIIDMDTCIDTVYLRRFSALQMETETLHQTLLARGVLFLKEAKSLHDLLEQYYAPHMDFAAINALCDNIIKRILGYAADKNANSGLTQSALTSNR
jgi:hypothetical protein